MIARAPVLDRLTALELFLLLWDDYGRSNDIGGPAVCGGASLLDCDGRVRIEAVRERPQPRLQLVPRKAWICLRSAAESGRILIINQAAPLRGAAGPALAPGLRPWRPRPGARRADFSSG